MKSKLGKKTIWISAAIVLIIVIAAALFLFRKGGPLGEKTCADFGGGLSMCCADAQGKMVNCMQAKSAAASILTIGANNYQDVFYTEPKMTVQNTGNIPLTCYISTLANAGPATSTWTNFDTIQGTVTGAGKTKTAAVSGSAVFPITNGGITCGTGSTTTEINCRTANWLKWFGPSGPTVDGAYTWNTNVICTPTDANQAAVLGTSTQTGTATFTVAQQKIQFSVSLGVQ